MNTPTLPNPNPNPNPSISKALDADQSGSISRAELQRGLKHWNLAEQSGNEDLIDNLMAACDKDGRLGPTLTLTRRLDPTPTPTPTPTPYP